MARVLALMLSALVLSGGASRAADKAPAGTWKVLLPLNPAARGGGDMPLWLVSFAEKEGAWTGKVLASHDDVGRSEIAGASVRDGVLRFTLKAGDGRISFEGRVPEGESTKLFGAFAVGQGVTPTILERTALTSLDRTDISKDIFAHSKDNAAIIKAAKGLVEQAGFLKADANQVKEWVDKCVKASEPFGERWQREIILSLVESLNNQDGMAKVASPLAHRAERMLTPKDRPAIATRTLEALATALEKDGKAEEAKAITARIGKLDLAVRTQAFAGRPAKFNRVAVLEMFTGAECKPCVAADLGFDALVKTFKPADAILLQYHMHIPGPDPLANGSTDKRFSYYREAFGPGVVRGTPTTFLNGTPTASGAGEKKAQAQDSYDQFFDAILAKLDEAAALTLKGSAKRSGDKIDIEAEIADLKDAGASIKLRFLLVKDLVPYKGGNGVAEHHHVVRGFPGGVEGVALKEKASKHKASVDVDALRKEITKHLADHYKKVEEELPKEVPMEMKKLKVVALVQDDNTREVLQAIQIEIEDAK